MVSELTSNKIFCYFVLCLLYIIVGKRLPTKLGRGILKCLPIVLLLFTCVSVVQTFGRGPVGHTELTTQFGSVFFGLLFSCIGDFYLVFDGFFIHGIVSFAIAQAIYVGLFHGHTLISPSPSYNEVIAAAGIAVVSLSVYFYLLPKLNRILAACLFGYCVLISLMLWSSFAQMLHCHNASTVVGAIGAGMFYTSDLLLGVNRWRIKIMFGPELIMITYYVAQFLIVWSQFMLLNGRFSCTF